MVSSRPVTAPGVAPAEESVVSHDDSLVGTLPTQGVSEQRVQPVLVGTEEGVESQVDSALLGKPNSNILLRNRLHFF